MSHRMHIDNSVKLIGKLLFGIEKGSEILNSVRPAGHPLADDWDCLKSLVNFYIHFYQIDSEIPKQHTYLMTPITVIDIFLQGSLF